MNWHDPLFLFTVLVLGAALSVWLLQRFKLSPILAYLALGIACEPQVTESLHEGAELLADTGVVLLMFFIGLEFHLDEIRKMLRVAIVGGVLQVVLVAGGVGGLCLCFGLDGFGALVVGLMAAFSSTALVMKAFADRQEAQTYRARISLAILIFQDIAAILTVALLPLVALAFGAGHSGAVSGGEIARQLVFLFIVLPASFLALRFVLPRWFMRVAKSRSQEAFSLLSLGACLLVALVAKLAGASTALGAFLGGLVLSHTPFASQIMADLGTLRNLALGFFFFTVGLLVDPLFLWTHLHLLVPALAGLILLKALLTWGSLSAVRVPAEVGLAAGVILAQIGEFSFVLGKQSSDLGLLHADAYKFVLALAVLSMVATPFLMGLGSWIADRAALRGSATTPGAPGVSVEAAKPAPPQPEIPRSQRETIVMPASRAIVVGYGPVGRTLTRILFDFDIRPTVIDLNIETVKKLKDRGYSALFGDASKREILQAAGVGEARYLLVTLPDLASRMPVVATAALMNPNIKIFVRARYLGERAMLEDAGATAASYEEAETSVALARFLLGDLGVPDHEIEREAERIRGEIAVRTGFTMMIPAPPRKSSSDAPPPP